MRNINSFNVTAPYYIGTKKNSHGIELAEECNRVAKVNIEQFGEENSFETYKNTLNVVVSEEDIKKYGLIIVGAPE